MHGAHQKLIPASFRKTPALSLFFLLAILFFYSRIAYGQTTDPVINGAAIETMLIIPNADAAYLPKDFNVATGYKPDVFTNKLIQFKAIPPDLVTKKILVRFKIRNPGKDNLKFYFFPGLYFSDIILYRMKNDKPDILPKITPGLKNNISFRWFHLLPQDTLELLAEIYQVKTYTNLLRPRLIRENYLKAAISEMLESKKREALFTYIFCGFLLMMVMFSLANYFQGSNREFLYYAGYAILMGLMLFSKPYYLFKSNEQAFFLEAYLDFILQCVGICFYLAFMIHFLETKKNYPFLHRLYSWGIGALFLSMAVYTFLHYAVDDYKWENILENYITKGFLLIMVIVFLVYAFNKRKDRLMRYLFWGNLFYLIFSLISISIIWKIPVFYGPFFSYGSLMPYEIGLLLELLFFLMGLAYKNRHQIMEQAAEQERLKLANERNELEKKLAVMAAHQEERNRISADMHDELGSGITTIRLMSEIAKNKMKDAAPAEISKISNSANELLNRINAIIWSMNSQHDTVDNLVAYIRAFVTEFLDGTSIDFKITTPENIPVIDLTGDKRRNIFLCVKELLNNALKYSKANRLNIDISVDKRLCIIISDDGIGFDPAKTSQFGNGLKNIARRMQNIGGRFTMHNKGGTESRLEIPL
jgi:signal transduction histidine kinase